jgi:hypothetical protein
VLAERGVKVSDLTDPKFSFIPQIFESRGGKSLVPKSVNPYVALASSSIYVNILKIKTFPVSFDPYLREVKISVTSKAHLRSDQSSHCV